jgi:hypothetical protein
MAVPSVVVCAVGGGIHADDDGVAGDSDGVADDGVTGDSGDLTGDCAADASDDPGTDADPVGDECLAEEDTAGLHALEGRRVLIDLAHEGAHLGRIQAPQAPNLAVARGAFLSCSTIR